MSQARNLKTSGNGKGPQEILNFISFCLRQVWREHLSPCRREGNRNSPHLQNAMETCQADVIFHRGNLHSLSDRESKYSRVGGLGGTCQTLLGQRFLSAALPVPDYYLSAAFWAGFNLFQLRWLPQPFSLLPVWPSRPLPLMEEKLSTALKIPPQDWGSQARALPQYPSPATDDRLARLTWGVSFLPCG